MSGRPKPPSLTLVRNDPIGKHDVDSLIEWLRKAGVIGASKISSNHLKIGRLNFYISTGVVHFDNEPRLPDRGPRALKATLEQLLKRDLPEFD